MIKSSEEIEKCILTLKDLVNDAALLANLPDEQRIALLKISGEISRPDRRERKKTNKCHSKMESKLFPCGIRSADLNSRCRMCEGQENFDRRRREEKLRF
ncbi:MAG: hypothetical protein AABZ10_10715 [Nitrospirota bacterium]